MVKCPKCGNVDLQVHAFKAIRVIAENSDDQYRTEDLADSGLDWDGDSWTLCQECEHEGPWDGFYTPEPKAVTP